MDTSKTCCTRTISLSKLHFPEKWNPKQIKDIKDNIQQDTGLKTTVAMPQKRWFICKSYQSFTANRKHRPRMVSTECQAGDSVLCWRSTGTLQPGEMGV